MQFQKGISGNPKGRKIGSKNVLPNRAELVELLNMITIDLTNNYDKLRNDQKIRILTAFNDLYKDSILIELQERINNTLEETNIYFEFSE
jgi:hypothetical protein